MNTSSLTPEGVARNVLDHRHDPKEHDILAEPAVRVTGRMIADYRKRLEEELRRIWTEPESLEEIIREECYESTDDAIEKMIYHGLKPEVWAKNLNEL